MNHFSIPDWGWYTIPYCMYDKVRNIGQLKQPTSGTLSYTLHTHVPGVPKKGYPGLRKNWSGSIENLYDFQRSSGRSETGVRFCWYTRYISAHRPYAWRKNLGKHPKNTCLVFVFKSGILGVFPNICSSCIGPILVRNYSWNSNYILLSYSQYMRFSVVQYCLVHFLSCNILSPCKCTSAISATLLHCDFTLPHIYMMTEYWTNFV